MAASPAKYKKFIRSLSLNVARKGLIPFPLQPFQENIIDRIFRRDYSWEEKRWVRPVREAVIGVGRKNGKTELMAAIALASLVLESEQGSLVVLAAAKRDQASLLLNAAKRMVWNSKIGGVPLSKFLQVRRNEIYFPQRDATLKTIAAEAQKEHGLNPHLVIIDEGHATLERDRELYDTLLTAQGVRQDPLAIVITTAGPAPRGPMYDLYQYGKDIENGLRQDPNFEFIWFEAGPDANVTDIEAWKAANPAFDCFPNFRRNALQTIRSIPHRMPEFMARRLHLNQWTTAYERWLPFKKVERAGRTLPVFNDWDTITIGLDAAISRDTFGVVWVRESDDSPSIAHVRAKRFVPDVEGSYIDPDDVVTFILGLGTQFNISKVVYDPAYMQVIAGRLQERGVNCEPFPQSAARMERATEVFQRMFIDERIIDGADKILRAHISAIAVKPTERGVRMSKLKALMPTDLAVALAMVLDTLYGEEQPADDFAVVLSR